MELGWRTFECSDEQEYGLTFGIQTDGMQQNTTGITTKPNGHSAVRCPAGQQHDIGGVHASVHRRCRILSRQLLGNKPDVVAVKHNRVVLSAIIVFGLLHHIKYDHLLQQS